MRAFLLSLFFIFPFYVSAQSSAVVDITFQNSKVFKIEKRSFFKFKKPDNFTLTRLDQTHYILNYLDNKPGVVFVNGRPILITPGDNVKLTYELIIWDDEQFKDSLSAFGNNAKNYTYSNFLTDRLIKGDIFPDLRDKKYQTNSTALYADLIKAYAFREAYYESYLKEYKYGKDFGAYVKRLNHIQFLANALSLETQIAENYKTELPMFTEKVHAAFLNTHFIPADTNYTNRMEETFYAFFWHSSHVEFSPVDSQKNFHKFLTFIMKYPDPFVREYFLYFIIVDYNEIWKKHKLKNAISAIQNIKNPEIKRALKNYSY